MLDVLLIDGEPQILELTKFFLEREEKFEVETALSGRTALDMMVHRTYDAVVSDYQMPELDGLELLKILRAQGNDIPFILFTGRRGRCRNRRSEQRSGLLSPESGGIRSHSSRSSLT